MKTKRNLEGYLLIDHRNSPGVSGDHPTGSIFESATITCSHCGSVVVLNPNRTRPRHWCGKCDHYICDNPVCVADCHPLKQLLDELETQAIQAEAATKSTIWLPTGD